MVSQLREEVSHSHELLKSSQQPYGYLTSRLKEQQDKLRESRKRVRRLEEELALSREEKSRLVETKNQMAADLERLLSHKEVSWKLPWSVQ